MYTIENDILIAASPDAIRTALTTQAGLRGWWTTDCDVDDGEATFRFYKDGIGKAVAFRVDRADAQRVAMTCVRQVNNPDWLGTQLTFALSPDGTGTRVALAHAGYPARDEVYEMCVKGWAFFLGSLKKYVETGTGEPHAPATKDIVDAIDVAAPPARVVAALQTAEGIRAWWTRDCDVAGGHHVVRFRNKDGTPGAEERFRVVREDGRGIALECVAETNGIGWLATRLKFSVEPVGAGARVALVHAGFGSTSACYDECVRGWRFFLGSLKAYLETGAGTPHAPGITGAC